MAEQSCCEYHCVIDACTELVSQKRYALGYRTCLLHGEKPKAFTVAPAFNKGGYQLITEQNIQDIGRSK